MHIGWGELVLILAIVVLLVGARRLPEIGRSLGKAIRAFQRAAQARPGDRKGLAGGKSDKDDQPTEKP